MENDREKPSQYRGMGNFLGKARRNFYLTNNAWDCLHEMCLDHGVSHSDMLELTIRFYYRAFYSENKPITYIGGRKPR